MKKKNIVRLLISIMLFYFIFMTYTLANPTGTGGIGDGGGSAAGGSGTWNSKFGFYIAVYNSNNSQRGSVKTYDAYNDYVSDKWLIDDLEGWFTKSKGAFTAHPTKLYDYLNIPYSGSSGSYNKLIQLLPVSLNKGDYVIIEPYTEINNSRFTFRGIVNTSVKVGKWPFYENYKVPAVLLSNAAKVGSDITVGGNTYKAPTSNCTKSNYGPSSNPKFCGWSSNHYLGYGITIVRYDDIYTSVPEPEPDPKGSIKILKYKEGTSSLITSDSATFKIHTGENCNGTVVDTISTSGGIATTGSLSAGTYSIEESKVPGEDSGNNKPYAVPSDRCVAKSVNVSVASTTSVNIYNTPTCTNKLNELGSNPTVSQLLTLYNEYPNFNNLLNFDNPSCTVKTCDSSIKINETLLTGCLKATGESSIFTEKDLSCYDEKYSDYTGFYNGFCKNTLDLKNNLGVNKFYANAGQFLIHKISSNIYKIYDENLNPVEINSKYIATATLKKDCYILNGSVTYINEELPTISLYFNDEEKELNYDKEDNSPSVIYKDNFTNYTYSTKYNYKLNNIYLEKITGRILKEKTNLTTDAIEAISSNFVANEGNIYFDLIYNGKNAKKNSDYCTYSTKHKIVKDNNLDLELRLIDTKNPFNRKTKSNWCDGNDCSKDNNIVKQYIINSVNSYGLDNDGNKHEPLYKIILDSASIKTIRKYNEANQYSYYKLINKDGNLVNAFVYDLKNGVLNQYQEDGSIDYSFGNLKYKLEGTKTK